MAERRLRAGRSVEELEKAGSAAGQAETLEPVEEAGCGDEVGDEAAYE